MPSARPLVHSDVSTLTGRIALGAMRSLEFEEFVSPCVGAALGSDEAPEGVRFMIRSRLLTEPELEAFGLV